MRRGLAPWLGLDTTEHDAAWDRAETLLRDSVTADQYALYRQRGYLEVPSRLYADRTYRVDGWRPVAVFEHGAFVGAVCIRPREALPGPDVLLARKLLIEGAEDEFLESGNWLSPAWRPASAAPTMLLILFLLLPWMQHLVRLGPAGLGLAVVAVVLPVVWTIRHRRRTRRPAPRRMPIRPDATRSEG